MMLGQSSWVRAATGGSALAALVALWMSSCKVLGDHDSSTQQGGPNAGAPIEPDAGAPHQSEGGTPTQPDAEAPWARYVFLFIGDGMGSAQVEAAEAYLANSTGHDDVGGSAKVAQLVMSALPVRGTQQTSSWNTLITDSAAAATALATGQRTAFGVVSMDPSVTVELPTIAEVAKHAGMKVGIVTSVSLNHATPAGFYAHEPSRSNYHAIGHDLVNSDFDYFGGGGFLEPDSASDGVTTMGNVVSAAESAGYVVADTRSEFDSLLPGTNALAIGPVLDSQKALYYSIDRAQVQDQRDHISLAEFTQKGIDLLYDESWGGFFMMVEGGKIDWACHANDARSAIGEVLALDESVSVAVAFMAQHPQETLIVVTADHETGGMTLGGTSTGYDSHFENLEPQKMSFRQFERRIAEVRNAGNLPQAIVDTTLDEDMLEYFGLDYATLGSFEKRRIDNAYAKVMFGTSPNDPEEDALLYDGHDPLCVTLTHIIDSRAGISWASFYHTAAPVPVMAGGANATLFGGYYDNTDVAKRLAAAMHLSLPE